MVSQTDPTLTTETKGYIGERYDATPDLMYLNARYMDPTIGIFISPDWFEVTLEDVGTNRFAYAQNDPINWSDPNGNCPVCLVVAIGVALLSADAANAPGENDQTIRADDGFRGAIDTLSPVGALGAAAEGDATGVILEITKVGKLARKSKSKPNVNSKTTPEGSIVPDSRTTKEAAGNIKFQKWKNGDAIDKPLPDGSLPSWKTVRERYWKSRAAKSSGEFDAANLARMRKGNAPLDYNPRTGNFEPRELHHVEAQRYGGSNSPLNIRELRPDWHAQVDPYRNVPGITTSRGIR